MKLRKVKFCTETLLDDFLTNMATGDGLRLSDTELLVKDEVFETMIASEIDEYSLVTI